MPDLDGTLPSYTELAALLDALPLLVHETRRARRLSLRAAGSQMGVAGSTVLRIEAGNDCGAASISAALRWLDQTPAEVRDGR